MNTFVYLLLQLGSGRSTEWEQVFYELQNMTVLNENRS